MSDNTEQELEKGRIKAKRKITALDFTGANAAVALVSKDQGGPANSVETLCIKASNFSDEFLTKMQTVKVELSIPEFLEAFFKLEEDQADALAYLMGYREDLAQEAVEPEEDFNKWIEENMQSFEIVKSLRDSDNYAETLALLTENKYLGFLQDQEKFEKGLKKLNQQKQEQLEKAEQERKKPRVKKAAKQEQNEQGADAPHKSPKVEKSVESKNSEVSAVEVTPNSLGEDVGVDNPVVKLTKKENTMTKPEKVTVVEQTVDVEMVEKSQFEAIQKQFQEQQEQLQKALASVAKFEQEKQESIAKQRKAQVLDAVKDEAKAEVLFKAVGKAEDADFEAVVKALKELASAVDNSDLFVEKGATVEVQDDKQESPIAKALRNRLSAAK